MLVMRADNHGEGGILALTALVMPSGAHGCQGRPPRHRSGRVRHVAALRRRHHHAGDLGAQRGRGREGGVHVVRQRWVIPIAIVILIGLFVVQRRGTGARRQGLRTDHDGVVRHHRGARAAAHPRCAGRHQVGQPVLRVQFFGHEPLKAFLSLGSIFLVVTGGEALYADMGHFGRKPIQLAWYGMVLPCAGAELLRPGARSSSGIPRTSRARSSGWPRTSLLLPLVILATMATVIASQALISGAFSLTVQAVQLDYLPRIKILPHVAVAGAGRSTCRWSTGC